MVCCRYAIQQATVQRQLHAVHWGCCRNRLSRLLFPGILQPSVLRVFYKRAPPLIHVIGWMKLQQLELLTISKKNKKS